MSSWSCCYIVIMASTGRLYMHTENWVTVTYIFTVCLIELNDAGYRIKIQVSPMTSGHIFTVCLIELNDAGYRIKHPGEPNDQWSYFYFEFIYFFIISFEKMFGGRRYYINMFHYLYR